MSQLKFLFLFDIAPSRNFFKIMSLKNSVCFFTFLCCFLIFLNSFLEFLYSNNNFFFIVFKFLVFSSLNFVSFIYMAKSLYQFDYKKSYIGNLAFTYVLVTHIILLILNCIFRSQFSCINFMFFYSNSDSTNNNNNNDNNKITLMFYILKFIIPNLFFLLFEFVTSWICFSYTKNLSEGNDALVDGQNFDHYIENLGSESVSQNNSFQGINSNNKVNDSNIFDSGVLY